MTTDVVGVCRTRLLRARRLAGRNGRANRQRRRALRHEDKTGIAESPAFYCGCTQYDWLMHGYDNQSTRVEAGSEHREAVLVTLTGRNGPTESLQDQAGVSMGPISLSFAEATDVEGLSDEDLKVLVAEERKAMRSIHSMTTEEWRATYEKDGCVDLWVEEEFNAGSRLMGGRAVHKGASYGTQTGEGRSTGLADVHHVTVIDRRNNQTVEVDIPEDRYVLWEAEDEGLQLPYACRMGCCTACAVKVLEGSVWQPQALGISKELKQKGYALMCVGYPEADCVLETVEEDELYEMQFGKSFAELAVDKNSIFVDRDDFALELAEMDE